jgi:hypothetical protein
MLFKIFYINSIAEDEISSAGCNCCSYNYWFKRNMELAVAEITKFGLVHREVKIGTV